MFFNIKLLFFIIFSKRYKCKCCNKSYSPPLKGIERGFSVTNQVRAFINNDFTRNISFSQIGEKYNLSTARVLQMFDMNIPLVPKLPLPKVQCIDEIRFVSEADIKYCCVLYDFFAKKIVDILKIRQLPYLKEYFSDISKREFDFTRQVKGIKYTNAIVECVNNKLKTILKSAYGYHNFERFRKRAMLICTYTPFK